ncbi:MAG: hypothetical protein AAB941_00720 [Patescibacteria group bacterium]
MAKKVRCKIDWHGNGGHCYPAPGTVKTVKCGVCGTQMKVKRNVLGCTSWAESMGGGKHLHDRFKCPNLNEDWHKRIYRLKMDVYREEMDDCDPIGLKKMRQVAEKEIIELLEAHAVR